MPEGDSVATDAARLRPVLEGRAIQSVYGTSASVRSNSGHLLAAVVSNVRTLGKNLLVDFSSGYSLRIHLGMTGRWLVLPANQGYPGRSRVVLTTDEHHVACLGAPTVEVERTGRVDLGLGRLGPDVLGPAFDVDLGLQRARAFPTDPIARVLLNQEVVAGIGNVYKSELCYLAGVHPTTPVEALRDQQLHELLTRARALLAGNVGPGRRTTTGSRSRGQTYWVYGRAGRPCRRCSIRIAQKMIDGRATYWCPGCQPMAA